MTLYEVNIIMQKAIKRYFRRMGYIINSTFIHLKES